MATNKLCPMCQCLLVKPEGGETEFCKRRCHEWYNEWHAIVNHRAEPEINPEAMLESALAIIDDLAKRPDLYYLLRKHNIIWVKEPPTLAHLHAITAA